MQVRHQVPAVVELLLVRYGDDAERVVRSCLEHPGYGDRARYAFLQMLRELAIIRRRQARGHPVTVYRGWLANWRRLVDAVSRVPASLSLLDPPSGDALRP